MFQICLLQVGSGFCQLYMIVETLSSPPKFTRLPICSVVLCATFCAFPYLTSVPMFGYFLFDKIRRVNCDRPVTSCV